MTQSHRNNYKAISTPPSNSLAATRRTSATVPWSCLVFAILIAASIAPSVHACNIPVFRYALERWHPDPTEILVFANDELSDDDEAFVAQLGGSAFDIGSDSKINANTKVVRVAPNEPGEYADVWKKLSANTPPGLPYMVVRTELKDRLVDSWHGDLAAARKHGLLESPARQELRNRLLKGDSIVWLMVKSNDEKKNAATIEMLNSEFKRLSNKIKLPDGIGLPGSELYADVPLVLQFSVLEIDAVDEKESYLVNLLSGFHPEALTKGEPLVTPVFGRGRALEVMPANSIDGKLVEELTTFLCGACSCKVKGLNPGFDLLLSADWDIDLFGEGGERPNDNASEGETPLPTLISIPPGRKKR